MSNIQIVSATGRIEIYHNDLSSITSVIEDIVPLYAVNKISKLVGGAIHFQAKGGIDYQFSVDGMPVDGVSTNLQVDSVNGVAPTDNDDLFDKIEALIG